MAKMLDRRIIATLSKNARLALPALLYSAKYALPFVSENLDDPDEASRFISWDPLGRPRPQPKSAMALDLGISYAYLSKLQAERHYPSDALTEKTLYQLMESLGAREITWIQDKIFADGSIEFTLGYLPREDAQESIGRCLASDENGPINEGDPVAYSDPLQGFNRPLVLCADPNAEAIGIALGNLGAGTGFIDVLIDSGDCEREITYILQAPARRWASEVNGYDSSRCTPPYVRVIGNPPGFRKWLPGRSKDAESGT